MIQASWFIVTAMLDGASLEQAIELAERVIRRERVTLAIHRGGKWVASPFDWIPTTRTLRALLLLSAAVCAIKVNS